MNTDIELKGSPQDYGFPEKPTAQQITTWTSQEAFLAEYVNTGAIYLSAHTVGISPRTFERWLSTDNVGFQKRYQDAQDRILERMAIEVDRRAFEGVEKSFFNSKGELTGSTTQYSDNLAMFRMKKLDPSYRDNHAATEDMSAIRESLDILKGLGVPRVVEGTATVVEEAENE